MIARNFLAAVLCCLTLATIGGQPVAAEHSEAQQFDKYAWELFIVVNRPITLNPDPAVFWESWATAEYVFQDPGHRPDWQEWTAQPEDKKLLIIEPLFKAQLAELIQPSSLPAGLPKEPVSPPTLADNECRVKVALGQDVRLNESTVRFIADNKLYNVEGQLAMSMRGAIDFPQDSIEIKAYWDTLKLGEEKTFYSHKCGHSYFGLTALHITSKALPGWTWATFEHIPEGKEDTHNPAQCSFIACQDDFGASPPTTTVFHHTAALEDLFKNAGMEDQWQQIWRHYRLVGMQTSFTKPNGRPTLLGNSVMEKAFGSTSSCITCHSRSTISISNAPSALPVRLIPNEGPHESFNGAPSPCWYLGKKGLLKFAKLDFVWSLRRAKREHDGINGETLKFVANECTLDSSP